MTPPVNWSVKVWGWRCCCRVTGCVSWDDDLVPPSVPRLERCHIWDILYLRPIVQIHNHNARPASAVLPGLNSPYSQSETVSIASIWGVPPEELHLAWRVVTFFGDFRHLSRAYFLCYWAEILICWCLTCRGLVLLWDFFLGGVFFSFGIFVL